MNVGPGPCLTIRGRGRSSPRQRNKAAGRTSEGWLLWPLCLPTEVDGGGGGCSRGWKQTAGLDPQPPPPGWVKGAVKSAPMKALRRTD